MTELSKLSKKQLHDLVQAQKVEIVALKKDVARLEFTNEILKEDNLVIKKSSDWHKARNRILDKRVALWTRELTEQMETIINLKAEILLNEESNANNTCGDSGQQRKV